jgi:hypothetical protein
VYKRRRGLLDFVIIGKNRKHVNEIMFEYYQSDISNLIWQTINGYATFFTVVVLGLDMIEASIAIERVL